MAENVVSFNVKSRPETESAPFHSQRRYQGVGLKLLSRLQTTLEPQRVLALFLSELQALLDVTGLRWMSGQCEQTIELGRPGRFRAVYRLRMSGEEDLGELVIGRATVFAENELELLEQLIGLAIHSLRNALCYQQALLSARRDPLTGLGNRVALQECLQRELDLCARHTEALAIMVLDVDEFKCINDSHGHSAGDVVLRDLAQVLKQCSRQSDLLFRYAGDEFVIVMSRTDVAGATAVAERVRSAVAATAFRHGNSAITVTVSAGVAAARVGESAQAWFERADQALLASKREGRDRVGVAY